MNKKKITLEGGRYLIYYTFERKPQEKKDNACCDGKCGGGRK